MRWWKICGILVFLVVFYNEYLIFFGAFQKCTWQMDSPPSSLKALMLSDTHLLGKQKGHWLDKLKREWQMYQAFWIATWLLKPDVVFVLGDLTDEGQWAGRQLFGEYADRFRSLFGTRVVTLAGNHDLGFHYVISPETVKMFEKEFNRSLIDEIRVRGHRFVLINSMAMHGDGCRLCHEAEVVLEEIRRRNDSDRPVVLQHFPLFRKSDAECEKLDDEHEIDLKEIYREQWDTLSQESTRKLIDSLNPKAVFGGHTHKMCKKLWKTGETSEFYEYTINSFSWRNGDVPAFFLATFDSENVHVNTCRLPSESVQITVYIIAAVLIFIYIILAIFLTTNRRRSSPLLLYHHSFEKHD